MNMSINSQILGRILRLPAHKEIRGRLMEKLAEYRRRRLRYVRENQTVDYGVLVGTDKNLLDAHYKETLFSTLLEERVLKVGKVYQRIKSDFRGFMDDALFNNAIQVLSDYLYTGGSNTSGGSGFLNRKMFQELLVDNNQIQLPRDSRLNQKLLAKYHEYLGRIMDSELHPDLQVDKSSLVCDTYKAGIINVMRHQGSVDVRMLAEEFRKKEGKKFQYRQFMQAVEVVRNYCVDGGQRSASGAGLH